MHGYIELDIGKAILTEYSEGFLTVQINAYGEEKSGVAPYDAHSPCGFIGRPHDPDSSNGERGRGCTVLYGLDGSQGHAWIQSDPRVIPLLPPLRKGGACLYGGRLKNPSFTNVDGDTGSVTTYVPYRIVDGVATKSMTIEVNVDTEGNESISIIHGSAAAFTIVEKNGKVSASMKNAAGDAYVEVNDDGVVVNGPLTVNGSINGGGPESAQPLVLGTPLATLLTKLINIVGAINTTTTGAPATALLTELEGILAKNTSGA